MNDIRNKLEEEEREMWKHIGSNIKMGGKNVQIVKMSKSILEFYRMIMDFDNEGEEYRKVAEKEFIGELTKSLNCGSVTKEIVWID